MSEKKPSIRLSSVFLLWIPFAAAHQPGVGMGVTEIEDATISWAIYGEFAEGDEVSEIYFTLPEPYALPFELLVPHIPANEEFRPNYAIVGPGLPLPTDDIRRSLPRPVPENMGVFWDKNDVASRDVIFEGFLRRVSWSSGTIAVPLREGDYQVWIWSPEKKTGEFVFGFGVEEDFSDGFGSVFEDWGVYAY